MKNNKNQYNKISHRDNKWHNKQASKYHLKEAKKINEAVEEAQEFEFISKINLKSKYAMPLLTLLILGNINRTSAYTESKNIATKDQYRDDDNGICLANYTKLSVNNVTNQNTLPDNMTSQCVLFKIYGAGVEFEKAYKPLFGPFFTNTEILKKYCEIVEIGDHKNGVTMPEIEERFSEYPSLDEFNVQLMMHGGVKNGDYGLVTHQYQLLDSNSSIIPITDRYVASELFDLLGQYANDRPLNLLVTSCHGANIHKYTSALPYGSKVMTESDKNLYFVDLDARSEFLQSSYDIIFSDGKFDIEKLMIGYGLNQKYSFSTPIVSEVMKDMVTIKRSGDSLKSAINSKINEKTYEILDLYNIDRSKINFILDQVRHDIELGKTLDDYKVQYGKLIKFEEIQKHLLGGTLQQYSEESLGEYYVSPPFLFEDYKCASPMYKKFHKKDCTEKQEEIILNYKIWFELDEMNQVSYAHYFIRGNIIPIHSLLMAIEALNPDMHDVVTIGDMADEV